MLRCVIADDSPVMRPMLRAQLSGKYDVVGEAKSGREALDLCRSLKPDVLLIDVIMPPQNGDEVARVARQEGLVRAIVFVTSQAQAVIDRVAQELGAKRVIKPYNPQQLLKVMAEVERDLGSGS